MCIWFSVLLPKTIIPDLCRGLPPQPPPPPPPPPCRYYHDTPPQGYSFTSKCDGNHLIYTPSPLPPPPLCRYHHDTPPQGHSFISKFDGNHLIFTWLKREAFSKCSVEHTRQGIKRSSRLFFLLVCGKWYSGSEIAW